MNELSQYLVNQILLEDTELHKFVVVYSGRFQPFHKGHYATYQNLCKKFGKDKVFIGTSNKTDSRQSPFNFKEKKIIMTKMFGIPSNKIVEIKNPYAPTEILKNFDETTTGYISVVGEKDEMRLGGKYFEKYKGKIEQGYKEKGYVYVSPSQSNPISGTNVRNWLSKGDEEQQRAGFLKAYPKFDEKIFKLITLKLKTMSEGMPGGTGIGISLPNGTINGAPKPEDVKKMRKKLDDEDDINEVLNEVKWEGDTFARCMQGQLPLSLNIVKQLVDPIKTTSLHVTTIENLPKVAALEGTKKSISTFNKIDKYSKIIQNGKGVDTDGGIFVLLSGVVLAQSIMDLWTAPDKQGRRWVNPGTIIADLGRETDVVFNFAPELKPFKKRWKEDPLNEFTPAEKNEFIRNYYDAAQKFMLSKKKEFQDKYLNSNKLYYESDWNEVVLTQIKIEKILAIPSNWSEDEVENQKTLEKLKQKYPKVEVGENTNDIQNFIKKNGGSIRESVSEDITLDVNIGDTILMGKFKNKKTVVKTIGKDEHGMPTINGKKVATFRILPKVNIFKEAATVSGGDDSQPDGGYLPKGKARVLGGDDGVNSSDDWFVRGGYTQTDFPKADAIYAADDENQITFKIKTKNNARNLNKPTTYPLGFDDVDVTHEVEKIEKAEKRLKKKSKQKDSISELISDYSDLLDSLFESDGEDDKYVHVGNGKYKEKTKKDVDGAPLFKKDDNGKYSKIAGDEEGGTDKPTGQAIQGADMFKHDKSVKQPNDSDKDFKAQADKAQSDFKAQSDKAKSDFKTQSDKAQADFKAQAGDNVQKAKAKGYDFYKLSLDDKELKAEEDKERQAVADAKEKGDDKGVAANTLKYIQTRIAKAKKAGDKESEQMWSDDYTNKRKDYESQYGKQEDEFDLKNTKSEPTKKPAEDWTSGKDGWEILDDDRAKVTTIRDYSDEEYKGETGEYFENEVTKKVAPNAFKDESEMIQKMKDAKPVYISSEELQNMSNTDVGDILSASEEGGKDSMKARGKELADEYGKDWDRLEKGIEGGSDVPPPLVLRDKNGKLHLLAGNTRLMSFTAYGKKLPVKVIDYDGEFNYDEEETPQPDEPKRSISKNIQRKISGWAEKEKEFFTKGQDKPKSETRRSIGETLRDKAKGARNAIVHGFKHEAHLFKSAAKGVGNFVSGKEVTKEERKALLDVGKKVVIAGILGVATGGLSHGILPFAQHLAIEFVPHIVAETLLLGASKAALFADTNEDERALLAFVDKIIDGIENMEVPEDVMNTAIDTYNQKKDSDKDNLEEIAVQVDDIPNEPLTEVKKESVVNYYKEICKDLNIKPIAVKFGSVGHAGAATTYDTKTFVPEYITFDLSKVTDIERAILHEITHQILLLKQQNPFHNCNKSAGFKKLENKLIDRYFYSSQSAVLREKVKVEMAKTDMDSVEKYADSQMSPTDVDLGRETDHFFQRLNDPRNGKEISPAELTGLFKRLARNKKKFLEFLKQYKEFVVKDRVSNINIAFIKVADRLIAKTVMRKADFKSSTPVFTTEVAARYIEPKRVEGFLKKYPKVEDLMQRIVDKVKDVDRGYQIFLQYKNDKGEERYFGGKKAVTPKSTNVKGLGRTALNKTGKSFNSKSTYNYEWDGKIDSPTWGELFQYIWNKKYKSVNESLIMEGGAYGHMNHPFDTEINLTFGQLKDIVNRALDGNLEFAREKTDGQALAISWIDGRLVAARNKSHLKNKGAGALDINGVADKFAGRGELTDAYNFAMKDLSNAIKSLSQAQKDKVFKNGSCFMNIEVIYPTSVNVIPYGQPLLVFHGTMEYDENGDAIGESAEAGRVLGGMLKQVNADVQSKYTLQGPPVLKLPKSQDLSSKKGKYLAMISKLQKEFGLGDTAGVADYHQAWWENFVDKKSPTTLDNAIKMGLVKRWAFGEKGFRIDKNSIKDEKTLAWATKIDKEDHKGISKDNLMKFEDIFLGVGADVLEFTASVLTVNPDSALRDMKKRLEQTIKDVQASGDPKKIDKLKLELKRLNAIGGAKRIVPIEGIVFVYNGQTFKLTGAFASLNQLLGIFYA